MAHSQPETGTQANVTLSIRKCLKNLPKTPRSFVDIHKNCKRPLPSKLIEYNHAILLHKLYNEKLPVSDWVELNFNQVLTSCQTHFKVITKNFKVGNNKLASRLSSTRFKSIFKCS